MGMADAVRRSHLTVKTVDRTSLNIRESFHQFRERSPEFNPDYTASRKKIYLQLLQNNSQLNDHSVFQVAPQSFKNKIGLKKEKCFKKPDRPALESKSNPSLYRRQTCSACSSSEAFQGNDTPIFVEVKAKTKRASNVYLGGGVPSKLDTHHTLIQPAATATSKSPPKSGRLVEPSQKRPKWKSVWNRPNSPSSCAHENTQNKGFQASKLPAIVGKNIEQRIPNEEAEDIKEYKQQEYGQGDNSPSQSDSVLAINGNVVSFKGYGTKGFTNWFGKSDSRTGKGRRVLRELDLTGFSDAEIKMKITGKKFVIEAVPSVSRNRGDEPRKVRHCFRLPETLEVESLFLSRDTQGFLFIEKKTQ